MSPRLYALAADFVLLFHGAVILFNVFGLIAIPLGYWRGWSFVRVYWWRLLHMVIMGAVVLQAWLGRACFLTLWQAALEQNAGQPASAEPMIQHWIADVIFWPLPVWVFAIIYTAALAYGLGLWWLVPPRRRSGMS